MLNFFAKNLLQEGRSKTKSIWFILPVYANKKHKLLLQSIRFRTSEDDYCC